MSAPWPARNRAAIVGVACSEYRRRGGWSDLTAFELSCRVILDALADAGLDATEVDGFTLAVSGGGFDPALAAQVLGIPELRFVATLPGGGNGSAGTIGLAAAAVAAGMAEVVVTVASLQQPVGQRLGSAFTAKTGVYASAATPEKDFLPPTLMAPAQAFALLTQRHMHQYGTTRAHLAEIAISTRDNAVGRPGALTDRPISLDDYFGARMVSEPFGLYDCCLESEGAVALIVTSAERARDLRHPPAYVRGAAMGGEGRWGTAVYWMGMGDDLFGSAGHAAVARSVYARAGVGPGDVDVALLYDHFTGAVLGQLEDYQFCPRGEGGPFVADGNIRFPGGTVPLNTHGGNLSEAYLLGFTHLAEGVRQIRGTAERQVSGAEIALVSGGPGPLPLTAVVLGKEAA